MARKNKTNQTNTTNVNANTGSVSNQSIPNLTPEDVNALKNLNIPKKADTVEPPKKIEVPQPSVIRDETTGRLNGITVNGKTFLGISEKDINAIINQQAPQATPGGSVEASDVAFQQQRQEYFGNILSNLGDIGAISPERLAELQAQVSPQAQRQEGRAGALREGTTKAVSRGASFAAAGAAGGAFVGGIGAIPGAVGGFAAGVISAYWEALRGARKSEAKEDVDNITKEYQVLKEAMTSLPELTNPDNVEENIALYNAQYYRMIELEAQLKYLTDSNLKDYLSDGGDNLVEIRTFLSSSGQSEAIKRKIENKLLVSGTGLQ